MRLFAALPLPPPAVARLTSLRLRLATANDGLRWSAPEQWHITLQFFGDVDVEHATCLRAALAQAAHQEAAHGHVLLPAPELTLDSLGLFPGKGILYAAVGASSTLTQAHAVVAQASTTCGIVPEVKPFRPHITLARSKGRAGDKTLRALSTPELPSFGSPIRWVAEECVLLESTLRAGGAEYSVFARFPLQNAAGS